MKFQFRSAKGNVPAEVEGYFNMLLCCLTAAFPAAVLTTCKTGTGLIFPISVVNLENVEVLTHFIGMLCITPPISITAKDLGEPWYLQQTRKKLVKVRITVD